VTSSPSAASEPVDAFPAKAAFEKVVGSTFRARHQATDLTMQLVGVESGRRSDSWENFSLLFLAPPSTPAFQGTYRIEHEETGAMDLFLVPVAGGDEGVELQAVFSRPLEVDGAEGD
jgi:hypothetical protein